MGDFNSVPRASDNVYGSKDAPKQSEQKSTQTTQSESSGGEQESSMQRKGDRDAKNRDKEKKKEDKEEKKKQALQLRMAKKGASLGGKATLFSVAAGAFQGAAHGVVGAAKAAFTLAKSIPAMVTAVIGGILTGLVCCILAIVAAVVPVTDGAAEAPVAYTYRAAIGLGVSDDPTLLDNLEHESARRIYTVLSGFQKMDCPSDWPDSEYNVTGNYGGGEVTEEGTKTICYGLRPEQVFAVLGNWTTESGLDPTAVESIFDEPWMIGYNKQWAMANDFVVDLWASDAIGNKEYFEENSTIHRCGIGLAQWTDVLEDGEEYDVHNPGRNSLLMQYAKLFGMEYYTDDSHDGWNSEDWVKGDTTIESFWYDMDVQLAFALDTSDVGDTSAQWFWDWAAKGAEAACEGMSIFDADEIQSVADEATSEIEDRKWVQNAWTQGSEIDPRTLGSVAGDQSSGVYGIQSSSGTHVGTYDAIGDGTMDTTTFHHGEVEIDNTDTPTRSEYYSTTMIGGDASTGGEAMRETDVGPSYQELTGASNREVYYSCEGGQFQITYANATYTGYDSVVGGPGQLTSLTETEVVYNNGIEAVREAAKDRAIDMANDYWETFLLRYNPNRQNNASTGDSYEEFSYRWTSDHSHVVEDKVLVCTLTEHTHDDSCYEDEDEDEDEDTDSDSDSDTSTDTDSTSTLTCGLSEHTHDDSCYVAVYYIVDHTGQYPNLHDYSVDANALAQEDWVECFKYYYRKYLYEGMTAYYTAQFLCEYEGVGIMYQERLDNAMQYFDMWWDLASSSDSCRAEPNAYYKYGHAGVAAESTKDLNPGGFEDWFFHIEQPYAQGIMTAIEHTADELTDKQEKSGKIWEADQVMMIGDKTPYESHADLARAGCLIAWPTIEDSRGNNGTELYQYINDSVIGDGIYMSCDRSVCTAVRWSGYDDNFPGGNVITQLDYLVSSPNWVELDWGGDVSMLQPGDLLVRQAYLYPTNSTDAGDTAHHIVMYVGEWMAEMNALAGLTVSERTSSLDVVDGSNIMHGSFGERSPGIGELYDELRNYHAFRCIYPMAEGTSQYVQYHFDS